MEVNVRIKTMRKPKNPKFNDLLWENDIHLIPQDKQGKEYCSEPNIFATMMRLKVKPEQLGDKEQSKRYAEYLQSHHK